MAPGGLLKQPLLWFLVIGLALFIADSRIPENRDEIIVTAALRDRLATLWTTQTGLVATEAELNSLVDNWLKEEILYREALRMGLDREDSIIRRRLVQKLGFIAESETIPTPEEGELEDFYRENINEYTLPVRYSFRHLYFQQRAAAENALARINEGAAAQEYGEPTMLNPAYVYRSALDLNAAFGAGFAGQLETVAAGGWQGPVQSGFGFHLVWTDTIHPTEVTPFDGIRQQVLQDFQRARQLQARDAYVENLLEEYTIVVEPR